jgi:AcrR family transcriptional regulator
MRTKKRVRQKELSFIEQARRAQIIASAIEVIADLGYAQASLGRIGEHAKISKGVITYHFSHKKELMQAVMHEVFSQFMTFVVARVTDDQPWEVLRMFLLANADFLKAHRKQLLTLLEIAGNAHDLASQGYDREADIDRLAHLLVEGQGQGTFRNFDALIMATSILALRDSMISECAKHADLDIDRYVQEVITLVDHAIRQQS